MSKFILSIGLIGFIALVVGAIIHDLHGYIWAYYLMFSGLAGWLSLSIYRDLHTYEHLLTCKELFLGQ